MHNRVICALTQLSPTWVAVAISAVALFVVPFLTYRYAHKNNVKVLKEKWVSSVRDTASNLIGACDKLYYANDARYQGLSNKVTTFDSERKALQKRSEEAQAEVTATRAKLRLLFKSDSQTYADLSKEVDVLVSSVDKPTKDGTLLHLDTAAWQTAQERFLVAANKVIQSEWKKLSH